MKDLIFNNFILCEYCSNPLNFYSDKSETFLNCKTCRKKTKEVNGVFDFENSFDLETKNKIYDTIWDDINKTDTLTNDNEIEKKIVIQNKKLFNKKIILDAGVGDGRHLKIIAKQEPKMMICIDLSDGIYLAQKRWKSLNSKIPIIFIKGSLEKIKFHPKSIDLIWCTGVLTIANNYLELVKIFQSYAKESILLGLLSKNIFGRVYYLLNPFRLFFRYFKRLNILKIILLIISSFIYSLNFLKIITFKFLKNKNSKKHNLLNLKNIYALLQEPFISPIVNRIDNKKLKASMKKNKFKFKFLGQELFLCYMLFKKTKS